MANSKIAFIGETISPQALMASVAEREGLEAIVMVCRVDGCWEVCNSGGINLGGLSMAAIKLLNFAENEMHGAPSTWTPHEDGPA